MAIQTRTINIRMKKPYRPDNQNIRSDVQDNRPDIPKHTVQTLHTKKYEKEQKKSRKIFPKIISRACMYITLIS